uniref:Pentatricopeptide repeat-containing protein n=1 Tax=Arundo donax TaxID=35708 RepID=A0A0A9BZK9_ARUDO
MPRRNVFSHNALLAAHACDSRLAAALFARIPDPDLVSYNTLLASLGSAGLAADALRLFMSMRRGDIPVDGFTVSSAVSAVTGIAVLAQLRAFAVVSGLDAYASVKNSFMSGYGKGGLLEEAEKVFADMGDSARNHVSWNCMIAVYGQYGHGRKATELFQDMARQGFAADSCTLASVLSAFATAQDLNAGMELHGRLIKGKFTRDPHVGSGLVDLYSKCDSIQDACKAFSEVDKPDLVLWNTLISGYLLHDEISEEALLSFRRMQRAGLYPDDCSFVSVIRACCNMSSPSQGQQLHA